MPAMCEPVSEEGGKSLGKILRPLLVLSILCTMILSLPLSQAEAAFRSRSGSSSQGTGQQVSGARPQTGSQAAGSQSSAGSQPSIAGIPQQPNYYPPFTDTWNDYSSIQYSTVYCGPNGKVNCTQPLNNDFSSSDTLYLFGYIQGLNSGQNSCNVGLYDADGKLIYTIVGANVDPCGTKFLMGSGCKNPHTGYTYPVLSCNLGSFPNSAPGTWTACAFKPGTYIPSNCPSNGNGCLCQCHFKCHKCIPEFPSAAAPVAVVGLCGGIYCWLRKKQETVPAA
jgi:hypothetical protein